MGCVEVLMVVSGLGGLLPGQLSNTISCYKLSFWAAASAQRALAAARGRAHPLFPLGGGLGLKP